MRTRASSSCSRPHIVLSLSILCVFSLLSRASARRQMLTVTAAALNGGCGRKGLRDCAAARTLNGKISGQNTPAGGCPAATTSGRIFFCSFFYTTDRPVEKLCVCARADWTTDIIVSCGGHTPTRKGLCRE